MHGEVLAECCIGCRVLGIRGDCSDAAACLPPAVHRILIGVGSVAFLPSIKSDRELLFLVPNFSLLKNSGFTQ